MIKFERSRKMEPISDAAARVIEKLAEARKRQRPAKEITDVV